MIGKFIEHTPDGIKVAYQDGLVRIVIYLVGFMCGFATGYFLAMGR